MLNISERMDLETRTYSTTGTIANAVKIAYPATTTQCMHLGEIIPHGTLVGSSVYFLPF